MGENVVYHESIEGASHEGSSFAHSQAHRHSIQTQEGAFSLVVQGVGMEVGEASVAFHGGSSCHKRLVLDTILYQVSVVVDKAF